MLIGDLYDIDLDRRAAGKNQTPNRDFIGMDVGAVPRQETMGGVATRTLDSAARMVRWVVIFFACAFILHMILTCADAYSKEVAHRNSAHEIMERCAQTMTPTQAAANKYCSDAFAAINTNMALSVFEAVKDDVLDVPIIGACARNGRGCEWMIMGFMDRIWWFAIIVTVAGCIIAVYWFGTRMTAASPRASKDETQEPRKSNKGKMVTPGESSVFLKGGMVSHEMPHGQGEPDTDDHATGAPANMWFSEWPGKKKHV